MAKPPPEDPRVTDLREYRKAREQAKRKPPKLPKPPRAPGSGLLGTNRYAGLILAAIVLLVVVVYVLPLLRR